jgi:lipoprotein-releasing system ATP-binding protein
MKNNQTMILQCRGITKVFHQGDQSLAVLEGVDFQVRSGECVAIIGPSGTGKSTLLHLLGGLDKPTAGDVIVAGHNLSRMGAGACGRLRNRQLGFIYQFHHLLAEFTALENVAMPLIIRGENPAEAQRQARQMLTEVGLAQRVQHKPGELSGGERQRAAVARALVGKPACVLADEPTGNLDRHNATQVFELMLTMNRSLGTSLIVVTHDHQLADRMDAIWSLQNGKLERQPRI